MKKPTDKIKLSETVRVRIHVHSVDGLSKTKGVYVCAWPGCDNEALTWIHGYSACSEHTVAVMDLITEK